MEIPQRKRVTAQFSQHHRSLSHDKDKVECKMVHTVRVLALSKNGDSLRAILLFFSYFAFGSFFFIRSARLHKKLQKLVDLLDSEHEGKGYDALIRMDEKSIKQRLKSIR